MVSRWMQQYVNLHVDGADTQEKTTHGSQATIALPQGLFFLFAAVMTLVVEVQPQRLAGLP